jgi:hypothetical protein
LDLTSFSKNLVSTSLLLKFTNNPEIPINNPTITPNPPEIAKNGIIEAPIKKLEAREVIK